ncbi:DUF805 domain-containing protein [Orbus mooreae]|uniref:DUF805 domain-containing protein n=1 Tax=Orbus mooreae TaxID=3074107 RepID=UPI00370DA039
MNWYLKCIKDNYANFNGRARRQEYWMFTLFNVIFIIAILILAGILSSISETLGSIMGFVYFIYVLAVFIPNLAVTVRRLHDTGKSGWWILICLIPFGGIVLLVFMCMESMPMDNQYGLNPICY